MSEHDKSLLLFGSFMTAIAERRSCQNDVLKAATATIAVIAMEIENEAERKRFIKMIPNLVTLALPAVEALLLAGEIQERTIQ